MVNKKSILIIDDDDMMIALLSKILGEAGYKIESFQDGKPGYSFLSQHSTTIDLIVADVMMPEMEGIQLLGLLQDNYPHIPVLMMSANSYYLEMSFDFGAFDTISKPFDRDNLLNKVNELIN